MHHALALAAAGEFGVLNRIAAAAPLAVLIVTTFPGLHKNHHARDQALTDSNYVNMLSLWDRMFGTLTPVGAIEAVRGANGLAGCDGTEFRSFAGLMAAPFAGGRAARKA